MWNRNRRCPRDHSSHRPFQRLTGLKCRGKSLVLQRALTDFGAEKSFQRASEQLKEHYGVDLHRSSVRAVVGQQAGRAAGFVDRERREALAGYGRRGNFRLGEPWLIVESDGCMIRTGELGPALEGGVTPGRGRPRRRRRTQWREVRLSVVEKPGNGERRYAAALGPPERVGEQMLALALLSGYGENTRMHGVGDGVPWIAQQIGEVFPRQRFLLDRYHLLEHLHGGLPRWRQVMGNPPGPGSASRWGASTRDGPLRWWRNAGAILEQVGASSEPVGRLSGEPPGAVGLRYRPRAGSAPGERRGGSGAPARDSGPAEAAWNLVGGGHSEPHAGLADAAG